MTLIALIDPKTDTKNWMALSSILIVLSIASCAGKDSSDNILGGDRVVSAEAASGINAEEMYRLATEYIRLGDLKKAIQILQQLETYFPFSPYALQAQLDLASAYYRLSRFDDSILQLERFIRQHGRSQAGSRYLAYTNYMLGVNYADYSDSAAFSRYNAKIRSELDVDKINKSKQYFETVLKDYSLSRYAESAYTHLILIRKILADHTLIVAEHYRERLAWVGVINRCMENLNRFPSDASNGKALAMLREAWQNLDVDYEVKKIEEIMAANPQFDYRLEPE